MKKASKRKTISADDIEKSKAGVSSNKSFSREQRELLIFILDTFLLVTQMLNKKKVAIARLKKILFGSKTEKRSKKRGVRSKKKKKKKHKTKANDAETQRIEHKDLKSGDKCPECGNGKLYPSPDQKETVYEGHSPFGIKIFLYAVLRCNFCGKYYRAEETEEVKTAKASGISNLALLRYRMGMPHYRIKDVVYLYGTHFPSSTQWDLLNKNEFLFQHVYREMIRTAANADLVMGDDTHVKILEASPVIINGRLRKKIHTSGFYCIRNHNQKVVLFFTGHRNVGENLQLLLEHRNHALPPPVFMCDASSSNFPADKSQVNTAFCNAHARRRFIELQEFCPRECSVIIECYRRIYLIDRQAKYENLDLHKRMMLHKKQSARYVKIIYQWLNRIDKSNRVEPLARLGEAIKYMQKNRKYLTRFLDLPGCPLDNNLTEQKLKNAIIHRKNSLFYKTQHGAEVGDMYMSIINTCMENNENVMEYLNKIQLNYDKVKKVPMLWMPWNYRERLN